MKQFIALLLFSALVLLPSASFAEDSGPVAAEPPIEIKEVEEPDLSDFLSDKKDSVYFSLSDLGDDEPHPYANMTEYAPSPSEAHAIKRIAVLRTKISNTTLFPLPMIAYTISAIGR